PQDEGGIYVSFALQDSLIESTPRTWEGWQAPQGHQTPKAQVLLPAPVLTDTPALDFGHLPRLRSEQAPACARLNLVFAGLLDCMRREQFFGESYGRNCVELAACLRDLGEQLKAVGADAAPSQWETSTGSASCARQLLAMGEDATASWLQTLFRVL